MKKNKYNEIVINKYKERQARNENYSLRAFARDLDIPISSLGFFLDGKSGISRERAERISHKLMLTEKETENFCNLIDSKFARSESDRTVALKKINNTRFKEIQTELFSFISDWYNHAILELIRTHDFIYDFKWIAHRLGISIDEVKNSINSLIKLGFLKINSDGNLELLDNHTISPEDIPSDAIRVSHKQIMEKAIDSQVFDPIDEREFVSLIAAVNSKDIAKAKTRIRDFIKAFDAEFDKNNIKDEVYCLNINLFKMTKN